MIRLIGCVILSVLFFNLGNCQAGKNFDDTLKRQNQYTSPIPNEGWNFLNERFRIAFSKKTYSSSKKAEKVIRVNYYISSEGKLDSVTTEWITGRDKVKKSSQKILEQCNSWSPGYLVNKKDSIPVSSTLSCELYLNRKYQITSIFFRDYGIIWSSKITR